MNVVKPSSILPNLALLVVGLVVYTIQFLDGPTMGEATAGFNLGHARLPLAVLGAAMLGWSASGLGRWRWFGLLSALAVFHVFIFGWQKDEGWRPFGFLRVALDESVGFVLVWWGVAVLLMLVSAWIRERRRSLAIER